MKWAQMKCSRGHGVIQPEQSVLVLYYNDDQRVTRLGQWASELRVRVGVPRACALYMCELFAPGVPACGSNIRLFTTAT
jgi:hypothetical protein